MPKRGKSEWQTVGHRVLKGSKPTEVFHLKRLSDGSRWVAFRAEEHEEFLNDVLSSLKKMEGILNRPTFGSSSTTAVTTESVFCTNCGQRETRDHNYCGRCGSVLPKPAKS